MSSRRRLVGRALFALLLALAFGLLAGCRARSGGAQQGATGPSGGAKTVVRFASVWVNEPRKSTLEKVAGEFRARHPEIDLRIDFNQPDAYKTKIPTTIGGRDAPDVFFVWPGEWLRSFVRGGHVVDLTEELGKDGWRDSFLPHALPAFEYRGSTWGVPMLMQCAYFLYNKRMFEERGLAPPKTWDELLAVCAKFRADGIKPIGLSNLDKWPLHHYVTLLWQRLVGEEQVLADYDRETGGAFADPGYLEGLRMVQQLSTEGYFSANPNGTTRDAFRQLFATESVPMILTGTWDLGVLQDSPEVPTGFADKWDMFALPSVAGGRGNQQFMMGAPDGYAVSSHSQSREASVAWLRFLTSREVARELVTGLQELVCVKGAVDAETAGPKLQRYAADVEAAPGITPWTDIMLDGSVRQAYLDALQGILDGTTTPEEVLTRLREAHAKARAELAAAQTG